MKINKLDKLAAFIREHHKISIHEKNRIMNIPDGGFTMAEYYENLEREEAVSTGKSKYSIEILETELIKIEKEAILFLQEQFATHKDSAIYIVDDGLNKLKEILNKITEVEKFDKVFYWDADISVYDEIKGKKLTIEDYHENYYDSISKVLALQKSAIHEVLDVYENICSLLKVTPSLFKIKTKLTVDELGLLFRLLYELEKFDVKNPVEVPRMLVHSFSTLNQDVIKEPSMRNSFFKPKSEKTWERIDSLLIELRQAFDKLEDKFSK